MTVTAVAVKQSSNWLRYLISHDGAGGDSVTITTTDTPTVDLFYNAVGIGPIKKLARAFIDGFAQFAAGAKTQAQARALWLSDWTGVGGDPGNENTTTARCRITPRIGVGGNWTVDANVDGGGNPTLTISETQLGGARSCYLDVEVPQAVGAGGITNSL